MPPSHPALERQALQGRARSPRSRSSRARTCCRPRGWEEVADYALDWALEPRPRGERRRAPRDDVRITHIGGPTVAHRGRWLAAAHRPDVRCPRPEVPLRLGDGVAQAGRAGDRRRRPRADRRGAAHHDHHADNLDGPAARCSRRPGVVVTTVAGAARSAAGARARAVGDHGLEAAGARRSRSPRRRAATGRRGSRPIVGDVVGFALRWEGQEHGVLWISGDTVLYDGVREVARPPARSAPRSCTSAACASRSPARCATR